METYYQRHKKERHKDNPGYHKKWYKDNPKKIKVVRLRRAKKQAIYYAKWYKENGRGRTANYKECILEYRQKYPDRIKIYRMVNMAVSEGEIIKPDICSECGRTAYLHAHHYNYENYMNFIWLCASCHKNEHNKPEKP